MKLSEMTIRWVPVISCPECGENIVERADERDITTQAQARKYAMEHIQIEHSEGSS
jgi:predicted RNA-binding Zn-ribbon protein involved in translation (DUF1610 family)